MRRSVIAFVVMTMLPAVASAHHAVSTSGIAWVEPLSLAELEFAAAGFNFSPELRGNWQTVAVRAEAAVHERISIGARVPWTHIRLSDGRGALGLGDVETTLKGRLLSSDHGFILSAGLGGGFPTGEPRVGIGSGHYEVSPFLAASGQPLSWLVADVLATQKWSVGGTADEGAQHGALIAPHADTETLARLGLSVVWRRWYLRTSTTAVVAHQSNMDGIDAAVDLGFAVPGRIRVSLGGSIPLTGSRRFDWLSRLAAAYQFN